MRERDTAVALIAKAPVAGKVKTRFTPPCTPEEAADFARAFLRDTHATASALDVDVWCSHLGDGDILRDLLGADLRLLEQRGSDLDDRLANAATDLFAMGYERVVLLGADCPTVDAVHLQASITALETEDVALGPADDGGYVLIAMKADEPHLFVGIEMSTERVFGETRDRAEERGLALEVLPVKHDLDTIDALLTAYGAGELDHASNTLELLRRSPWAKGATRA